MNMRIGPDRIGGPNRGQKRQDWTIESRKTQRPLSGPGGSILLFTSRRQAQAELDKAARVSPYMILAAGMLRVAKLTKQHRAHAYKGRMA
jgi:hypothetical protein